MKIIRIGRLSIRSWLVVLSVVLFFSFSRSFTVVYGMAADCYLEPAEENYIGVRYKALLLEDELSETHWVLLFGGNGLTMNGEYQPHFINLMIKAGWVNIYEDPLCDSGFPQFQATLRNFTIGFGLDDYEDVWVGQDNDIAAWTRDPDLFPRVFSNIDSREPEAADFIGMDYQVDEGGTLEGREVEVSLVREEVAMLPQNRSYFMDPDLEGEQLCKPCSQADILYRRWIATLKVPSLGIDNSVDFYVNASQGDKIRGDSALLFMWEDAGRPVIESDKYKVILYEMEVKTTSGEWKRATRFVVDIRSDNEHLPLDDEGKLAGGYRKVNYKGQPAMEASFGYGYTDYVADANLNGYDPPETRGVIDLQQPVGSRNCSVRVVAEDCSGSGIPHASVCLDEEYKGTTDSNGELVVSNLLSGYHLLELSKSGYTVSTIIYVEPEETYEHIVIPEFPSFLILPLFMIATLLAVILYRRKYSL